MPTEETTRAERKKQPNTILRYSGMATQMMVIVVGGALAGMWLDGHFHTSKPYITAIAATTSVVVAMYVAVKDLLK